jgi:hypothetical protein
MINSLDINVLLTSFPFMALYADPGSGALIWQLIVGALVGMAFYFRIFFRRLKDAVNRKSHTDSAERR